MRTQMRNLQKGKSINPPSRPIWVDSGSCVHPVLQVCEKAGPGLYVAPRPCMILVAPVLLVETRDSWVFKCSIALVRKVISNMALKLASLPHRACRVRSTQFQQTCMENIAFEHHPGISKIWLFQNSVFTSTGRKTPAAQVKALPHRCVDFFGFILDMAPSQ